jgi:hypothetical protein
MDMVSMQIDGRQTRFTITERDGCVLVEGALPPKWLTAISTAMPKKAIVSPALAMKMGVNFAFGLESDICALMTKIRPDLERQVKRTPGVTGLSEAACKWLAGGERGISSNTIFTHLTGFDALQGWSGDVPHDPADVRRCRLLLERCPEFVPLFPKMAEKSKKWAALVRDWDAICLTMDAEVPNWRDGKSRTPATRTYQLIKAAIGHN